MGRKSTKENKNIYFTCRESLDLTREAAAELLQFVSADRIEKIENEKTIPHPEEVLAMSEGYKNPSLCNYFCSQVCPIGQKDIPMIKPKELAQITVEMMVSLNNIVKSKDRLMEITVDGEISNDEMSDFLQIQGVLDEISQTIDSLNLWVKNAVISGKIDKEALSK